MPITTSYTCDVCSRPLDDADLIADATLRRLIMTGGVAEQDASSPTMVTQSAITTAVFCSWAHAAQSIGALTT